MTQVVCNPACEFFRCGRRAKQIRSTGIWCSFINDKCDTSNCAYVQCIRNKILTGNICGLTIRRKTEDRLKPDDFGVNIKIKGKFAKRIGSDRDLV